MKWLKSAFTVALCVCLCVSMVYGTAKPAASEKTVSKVQPRDIDPGVMPISEEGNKPISGSYEGVRLDGISCTGEDENGRFCAIYYAVLASLSVRGIDSSQVNISESHLIAHLKDRGKMGDVISVESSKVDADGFLDQYLISSYTGLEDTNLYIEKMTRTKTSDNEGVKDAILASGGAIISYCYKGDGGSESMYSNEGRKSANREAVIVGWDDGFKDFAGFTPQNSGAWIVRDNKFKGGYGYISYHDSSLSQYALSFYATAGDYDLMYQFDGGYTSSEDVYFGYTGYMANQFISSGEQSLNSVGFFVNSNENLEYEVRVYLNSPKKKDPASGYWVNSEKKGLEVKGNTTVPGYYTADFKEPIMLAKDDSFAVVVILKSKDANVYLPIDTDGKTLGVDGEPVLKSEVISYATQSYVSMDGISWEDVSAVGNANVRIKAFTTNVNSPSGYGPLIFAVIIVSSLAATYFVLKYRGKRKKN